MLDKLPVKDTIKKGDVIEVYYPHLKKSKKETVVGFTDSNIITLPLDSEFRNFYVKATGSDTLSGYQYAGKDKSFIQDYLYIGDNNG